MNADDGILPVSRRRRAYAALILGTILTAIDSSIANVALPTIGRELHVSPSASVWVASSYLLAVTTVLFTVSSLGQSRGPTRMWGIGVALFTAGSLLCALSAMFPILIFARVMQGCGAAAIMSLSPALVRDIYPRSLLGHAFGMNAMYTSIASAAGPTVGGLLLAVLPWQWLFAINVPLAFAIVLLARGALPNVGGTRAPLDPLSIVLERARLQFARVWSRWFRASRTHRDHRSRTHRRRRDVRMVRAAAIHAAGADDLARSVSHPAFLRGRASQRERLVGVEHRHHHVAVFFCSSISECPRSSRAC